MWHDSRMLGIPFIQLGVFFDPTLQLGLEPINASLPSRYAYLRGRHLASDIDTAAYIDTRNHEILPFG